MTGMETDKIVESSQEQAVASWINYLNHVRIDRMLEALRREETNLENALDTIKETLNTIDKDIINNGLGRGGVRGMHGFIAEAAEVGIGNARALIEGKAPVYEWVNDNGPEDLKRGAILIQQKFVQGGNHLSLNAVAMHLEKYPNFLENQGKYQIPADHYEKIKWLLSIPKEEAYKMPTSTGEFSMKQWKDVHAFFESGKVPFEKLEPSILEYDGVQRGTYEITFEAEKQNLEQRNAERLDQAHQKGLPNASEGIKAAAGAALVEGGMVFCLGIVRKRKAGKAIRDFNEDDWKEIAGDTGLGTVKGGIRGASIYMLTNFTATPAAAASSIVTASFGVAEQAYKLRNGELTETEFILNSEILCLDATVSAVSSFAGQVLIPVPVLGAVIGNAVGTMLYQIAKDNLSEKEQALIDGHLKSLRQFDEELQAQYQAYVDKLSADLVIFMGLLDRAFAPDIRLAFDGSIELAREMGVPADEILDSREKLYSYFMD